MTISVDLPVPARALAIGAHPDDIEFGAGATLARWADRGCEVHMLVCTDGSKGTWDRETDLAALVLRREAEQREAAASIGVREVHFLRAVDGELENCAPLRAEVCKVVREVQPGVVLTHDPWKRYRLHPDHRNAGFLALDALVAARDPHFFPEQGLAPHRPAAALLFEPDVIDHVESVASLLPRKVAALLCHKSQWRSTMGIGDDPERERAAFEERLRLELAGDGDRPAGEPFKRIEGI